MGPTELVIKRAGVSVVFTHPDAQVDVVLVHGLNGEPKKSWTAANGVYWPAELLPQSLQDRPANILVYGYNADAYSRSRDVRPSDDFIFQRAQTLLAELIAHRKETHTEKNPIIWIAHSLGGILVKRALLYGYGASAANLKDVRDIYISTYAIVFLGTPHTGAGLATWGRVLQAMSDAIVPKKLFESESILLKTLKRDNERLQEINSQFLDIYQRFKIHMAHENHTTDLKGTRMLIVDTDSASPQLPGVIYYGIEATHSGMCKFSGFEAPGYQILSVAIKEWVAEAPRVIEVRLAVEQEDRDARARRASDERRRSLGPLRTGDAANSDETDNSMSPLSAANNPSGVTVMATEVDRTATPINTRNMADATTSPMPQLPAFSSPGSSDASTAKPDPLFLHPEHFRPNSYFVGRKKELEELHRMLTDKKRRAEGTSAVVIHNLPGGGKTHLARQYVFHHRNDYPGGIYWVRAKSIPEMEQFYWKIAKNEALREIVQKNLGSLLPITSTEQSAQKQLCDPQNVVNIVRQWFSSFDRWLLVFDGILFSTEGIDKFIPDAKNTSIIYTSIQNSASGRYEFDNPQTLELGMLSEDEAEELLLTEMEKKKPWSEDDRVRARELVKLMGYLPLMVHIAAQHLKATREPLSKYLRTFQTRIRAPDLPAYRLVLDELKARGANPALNLMYILAFFDSRVPVGLLLMGLDALDKTTPVKTKDLYHRKSLNTTLRTLIAFALLERSESDSISPSSSQSGSRRSYDKGTESVDLLRIHAVVQLFFIDVLVEDKQVEFWLERSARFFCRAFDEAHRYISDSQTKVGLLDDYRCFNVHGKRLREHLQRVEKRSTSLSPSLMYALAAVNTQLSVCERAIAQLSEATQKYIVTQMDLDNPTHDDYLIMSVFEHASNVRDSDDSESSASPSSQVTADNSGSSTRTGTGFDDERAGVHIMDTNLDTKMDIDNMEAELGLDVDSDLNNLVGKGKAPMDPTVSPTEPTALPMGPAGMPIDPAVMVGFQDRDSVLRSPGLVYSSTVPGGYNPHEFHAPYSPANPIPESRTLQADEDEDDALTEMPTPHIRPGLGPATAAHRTVRKLNDRRYHDTAGAWRDNRVSDPRISISRELAQGSVSAYESHTEPLDKSQLTAQSPAELSLNRIRVSAATPSSPPHASQMSVSVVADASEADDEAAVHKQNKGRSQSTGTMGVRPLLTLRQASQEQVSVNSIPNQAMPISTIGRSSEGESAVSSLPTTSSTLLKRLSQSPPAAWTNSVLKRFKENILPSRGSTPKQQQTQKRQQHQRQAENIHPDPLGAPLPPADNHDDALSTSIDSLLNSQASGPGPMFRGSRTASSTPNHGYGPFAPPPPLPPAFHHYTPAPSSAGISAWDAQVYHPGHQRLSSADLGFGIAGGEDPMASSYPSISRPGYPQQQFLQPTAFVEGYTSQPMSRNTSSQSQPGVGGYNRMVSRYAPGVAGDLTGFPPAVDEEQLHSHSLPLTYASQPDVSMSMPMAINVPSPLPRRISRSSLVETEPSPQTANPFPDVNTSYRRYEERHMQGPYMHSYRVTEMQTTPAMQYRPALGAAGGFVSAHGSGSASGSGSGGAGRGYSSEPMSRAGSGETNTNVKGNGVASGGSVLQEFGGSHNMR